MRSRRLDPQDDDVPRLPRGKGITLTWPAILRIGMTAAMLVLLIVMAKPCSRAIGNFVGGFDKPDAAVKAIPTPGQEQPIMVPLTGKSEAEQKKAIEEAREQQRLRLQGSGSGSGAGSAAPPPAVSPQPSAP